jgi:hypothetical protein
MSNDTTASAAPKDQWIYIQIVTLCENFTGPERDIPDMTAGQIFSNEWTPWKCKQDEHPDYICRIALNRYLRDSGYTNYESLASVSPLVVQVSWFDDSTPRFPNGNPGQCHNSTYTIHAGLLGGAQ